MRTDRHFQGHHSAVVVLLLAYVGSLYLPIHSHNRKHAVNRAGSSVRIRRDSASAGNSVSAAALDCRDNPSTTQRLDGSTIQFSQ